MGSVGAVSVEPITSSCISWTMNTIGGPLSINIWKDLGSVYSVTARFEDVGLANTVHFWNDRLNPHSGKWNFHAFELETIMKSLTDELNLIKIK